MRSSNGSDSDYIALIPNVKLYGAYAGSSSNVNFGALLFTPDEILFVLESVLRSTSLLAGFGYTGGALVLGAASVVLESLKRTVSKGSKQIPPPDLLKQKKSTIAININDITDISVDPIKQGWFNLGIVSVRVVFNESNTGLYKPGVRKNTEPLEVTFYPQLNKDLKNSWQSQGFSKEAGIKDFAVDICRVIESMQS